MAHQSDAAEGTTGEPPKSRMMAKTAFPSGPVVERLDGFDFDLMGATTVLALALSYATAAIVDRVRSAEGPSTFQLLEGILTVQGGALFVMWVLFGDWPASLDISSLRETLESAGGLAATLLIWSEALFFIMAVGVLRLPDEERNGYRSRMRLQSGLVASYGAFGVLLIAAIPN